MNSNEDGTQELDANAMRPLNLDNVRPRNQDSSAAIFAPDPEEDQPAPKIPGRTLRDKLMDLRNRYHMMPNGLMVTFLKLPPETMGSIILAEVAREEIKRKTIEGYAIAWGVDVPEKTGCEFDGFKRVVWDMYSNSLVEVDGVELSFLRWDQIKIVLPCDLRE